MNGGWKSGWPRRWALRMWQILLGRALQAVWLLLPTLPLLGMAWSYWAGIR